MFLCLVDAEDNELEESITRSGQTKRLKVLRQQAVEEGNFKKLSVLSIYKLINYVS